MRIGSLLVMGMLVIAGHAEGQSARLRLVAQRRIGTEGYAALGLSGVNKPNGREYRLRMGWPGKLPIYVPRTDGDLALYFADPTPDGWLVFYRTPTERSPSRANATFSVTLFGPAGERRWTLPLNPLLSRRDRLEVTDARYVDGKLYFNESCQSYSREAGGRCSSLGRVDPRARRVEWRTRPLVSNGIFLVDGPWVIAGYGFTAEPDFLRLIDRETGAILFTQPLDTAADYMEMRGGRLYVTTTRSLYAFEIVPVRAAPRR